MVVALPPDSLTRVTVLQTGQYGHDAGYPTDSVLSTREPEHVGLQAVDLNRLVCSDRLGSESNREIEAQDEQQKRTVAALDCVGSANGGGMRQPVVAVSSGKRFVSSRSGELH